MQQYFPMEGGLDLVSPQSTIAPGAMTACKNYEEGRNGGYTRVDGYERYSGKAKPSLASTTADQEVRRTAIAAPAGSGSVLGVWGYNNKVYCFRNDAAGDYAVMYEASASGWTAVTMSHKLAFDAGTAAFTVGATLSGATATATIGAIIVTSGTWGGANAAGFLYLNDVDGTFVNNEVITDDVTGSATANGANAAITFQPDGRYEFVNYNFFGASDLKKMYWVDGVNKLFQYDGTTVVEIPTGMTVDTPDHLAVHANHLFVSFPGGSIQFSSITDPTSYSVVVGAGEIGVGDDVTSFTNLPGGILGIFCRNSTWLLSGTSSADFVLKNHSYESGALEWSLQKMAMPIYVDDRGITTLSASDMYGDFADNNIAKQIFPYLQPRINNIVASLRVRDKNQYRVFFDDGEVLTLTLRNNKVSSYTRQVLPIVLSCACSVEDSSGDEVIYAGATNGYVYQLDSGTNFDGAEISAFFRTPYYHYRTPIQYKRFRRMLIEMDSGSSSTITLKVVPDFSFSDDDTPKAAVQTLTIDGGGDIWGDGTWGTTVLGAAIVEEGNVYIDGNGRNMGIVFYSGATYEYPHTIHGLTVEYSVLGRRR